MQIREIRFPEEFPQVLCLWNSIEKGVSLSRSDTLEETRKHIARTPDLFLVAEEDGEIIGTVIGGFDGRRGIVYHLAVAAPYRGRGIGSRLMGEIESRMLSKGCLRSYMLVTTDNPEAMDYYQKHGWERMDGVVPFAKSLD